MNNKENVSKLISYWLRHNPEDANLTIDEFGWVPLNDVLEALKLKGHELTSQDLFELNQSFDKMRWELNEPMNKIRATHGHSIPVLNDKSSVPPVILFHGTASRKLEDIFNKGLLPMQRQFVHLSANLEQAIEVGKRHGKPIIIKIDAEALYNNGFEFYKTSENVWLIPHVPNEYLTFAPWQVVSDEEKTGLLRQLKNEITASHMLYHSAQNLELIMRRHDCDDALFRDKDTGFIYEVHLTWHGEQIDHPNYPLTKRHSSLLDWVEKDLIDDQRNWYCF